MASLEGGEIPTEIRRAMGSGENARLPPSNGAINGKSAREGCDQEREFPRKTHPGYPERRLHLPSVSGRA
jgi:hypothetical protein